MTIEISIIVACRNEERDITNCLESISRQTFPKGKFETIIVDGGSTDKTLRMAERFRGRIRNLVILRETGPRKSPGNARNQGAGRARGEILVIFDADVAISPQYLEEIMRAFGGKIDAASTNASAAKTSSIWANLRNHETLASNYLVRAGKGTQFPNVMTKRMFKRIGEYDPELRYGEDLRLLDKLKAQGARIAEVRGAKSTHREPDSLNEIGSQAKSWGRGFHALFVSDPVRHAPRLAMVSARALWLPLLLAYFAAPLNLLLFLSAFLYLVSIADAIIVAYRSLKMGGKAGYAILLMPFRMIRSSYFLLGFCLAALGKG